MAKVSIGIPVYNGAATLSQAIESLRMQTFGDIEITISDNASHDETPSVAQSHSREDDRIRYIRQPHNVGAQENFRFLLESATGEYFMWAAADDRWSPEYVERCVAFLDEHADYAACVSRATFGAEGDSAAMGTYPLGGAVGENLSAFIRNPGANSRFYGLHRRSILADSWIRKSFWASDWATVCNVITRGKYGEIPQVLMMRGAHGASSNGYRTILALDRGWLHAALPYLEFSVNVLAKSEVRYNPRILVHLLRLNADAALMMLRKRISSW